MNSRMKVCLLGSATFLGGCGPSPAPQAPARPAAAIANQGTATVIARPEFPEPVNEDDSFVHEYTGIKLCSPPGWNVEKPNTIGFLADIGVFKGSTSVVVIWGRTHTVEKTDSAMLAKDMSEQREMYGKQVSDPELIRVGDQLGYRYTVAPPLRGIADPKLRRVTYLFYVDSAPGLPEGSVARGKYTISVLVTAEEDDLKLAAEVLYCLRWK